jgi:hypothetical protein
MSLEKILVSLDLHKTGMVEGPLIKARFVPPPPAELH